MLAFIITVYGRVFKLFAKSFILILPFNALYAMTNYLLNIFMPLKPTFFHDEFRYYASHIMLNTITFTFFFVMILYAIQLNSHHQQTNYRTLMLIGIKRFMAVFFSLLIIALPFIVMAFLLNFFSQIFEMLSPPDPAHINSLLILMSLVLFLFFVGNIFWMGYCFYFFLAPFDMIVNNKNVIEALKHSRELIKNHWFKTFMLVFVLLFISTIIQIVLYKFLGEATFAFISLFILPLSASLMIVHYEHMDKKEIGLK